MIAACGEKSELDVLTKLWTGTQDELQDHLHQLTASGFLVATGNGYSFNHSGYRDFVYHHLLDTPRRQWFHKQIISALQSGGPQLSTEWKNLMVHHSEGSGYLLRAIDHLVEAVTDCIERYEHEEGLALIDRGMNLLEQMEQRWNKPEWIRRKVLTRKFKLLYKEATIRRELRQLDHLQAVVLRLDPLVKELNHARKRADLHRVWASLYERLSQYPKALEHAQAALAIYRDLDNQNGVAESLCEMGRDYFGSANYERAKECFAQSSTFFESLGNINNQIYAINRLGNAEMNMGNLDMGLKQHEQALTLAHRYSLEAREAQTRTYMGLAYLQMGHYQEALEFFEKTQSLAEKLGNRPGLPFFLSNRASVYYHLGLYERSADECRRALELMDELGSPLERGQIRVQLGWILRELGVYYDSFSHLQTALQIFREIGVRSEEADALRGLAETSLSLGDCSKALAEIQQALDICQDFQMNLLRARCQITAIAIFLKQGNPEKAINAAEEALAIHDKKHLGNETCLKAYLRYVQALDAGGCQEKSIAILRKARALMVEMAKKITSPELRQRFFNVRWRRELLQLAEQRLRNDN